MNTSTAIPPKSTAKAVQQQEAPHLTGGFFLTDFMDPKDLFISEEWTEEQQMIAELVMDFCEREVQKPFFKRGRELEISRPEDREEVMAVFQKAAELGLCSVSIPEEYGGMGLDFNTGVLFSEAIAGGFSFATTIGAQTSIGSLPIVFYGTEAQKQKYLPGIASGELIAAYALTEPSAGSDANAGKTRANLSADGSHYLLNGQKIWITNGGMADVFIVFAKIDDDEDLSAFIVEKAFGGITIGKEEKKMGIKASSTVQLFFDDCPVPVENLLSGRQAGFKIALNILNTGRIKLGAGGVGGAKMSVTRSVQFAKERKQFGQAIATFGAIRHKIGDITTQAFALDAALYRTGHMVDEKTQAFLASGMEAGEAKLSAVREFAIECAILKTKGAELACYATDEAMQIHGGMGYAAETGMEMGYRDARITRIYEGTNEVNRMLSVAELSKRTLKTKEIDLVKAGKAIPGFLLKSFLPFKSAAPMDHAERLVQGMKYCFLLISGVAGKKLRKELVEAQEIVLNLADILAETYVAESVWLKLHKLHLSPNNDPKMRQIKQQMMELSLYEARDTTHKAAKDAINSFATGFQRRLLLVVVNRLLPGSAMNPMKLRRAVADYVIEKGEYPF